MTTASVWIISFVFLVFTGSALTGPLVRESCVNESKNRVSRDFRALIKHGRDYHKDLVQKQEPRTAVLQTADVQQLDSKSECRMINFIEQKFDAESESIILWCCDSLFHILLGIFKSQLDLLLFLN
jgi:hypothetical protein